MRQLRLIAALFVATTAAFFPILLAQPAYASFVGWSTSYGVAVNGSCLQFSYMQGQATKSFPVGSEITSASFSITVDNSTTNTIGSPNPTPDSYGILVQAINAGAVVSTSSYSLNTAHGAELKTLDLTYAGHVDAINVVLSGIDSGFWGGNFGPIMCGPTLSVATAPIVVEPAPVETSTPQVTPSPTPTDGATVTTSPTPEPSLNPSATPEPAPSESPTATAESSPTPSPSLSPEPTPTPEPTVTPTLEPSAPTFPENSIMGIVGEGGLLQLVAPATKVFTSIFFASYGTPNEYQIDNACHAESSMQKVIEFVLGRQIAEVAADNGLFGDPCGGTVKRLAVIAIYGESTTAPSTSDSATLVSPTPEPSPSAPAPESSPSPSPTPEPSREPAPQQTVVPQPPVEPRPEPVVPSPTPTSPEPSPSPSPTAEVTPSPEPSPEPSASPSETPEPSPTPSPEETPIPQPSPTPSPEPTSSASPEPTPTPTDNASEPPAVEPEEKPTTEEEKAAVGLALVAALAPGEALSATALAESGITYADLPPATPVEVRTDAEGNPVVITAEVADALTLVENPAELVGALFTDPAKALLALGSLGADMSPEEREDAQKAVVAAVVVGQLAASAAASVTMTQRRVG